MNANNVMVLDEPIEVDTFKWAFEHPDCSALVIKSKEHKKTIKIKAYALNEDGNDELNTLPFAYDSDIGFFRGVDSPMLNNLGGIV